MIFYIIKYILKIPIFLLLFIFYNIVLNIYILYLYLYKHLFYCFVFDSIKGVTFCLWACVAVSSCPHGESGLYCLIWFWILSDWTAIVCDGACISAHVGRWSMCWRSHEPGEGESHALSGAFLHVCDVLWCSQQVVEKVSCFGIFNAAVLNDHCFQQSSHLNTLSMWRGLKIIIKNE